MSLEAKIELLTTAVTELTRAIQTQQSAPQEVKIYPNSPAADTTKKSAAKSAVKEAVSSSDSVSTTEEVPNESSTSESSQASAPTGESSSPALTYKDDVKPATLKLSQQKGREVAIAVLARFGVKGAQELDEAQWSDYVAHVEHVLAGGEV